MSKTHYSVGLVMNSRSQFAAMVKEIIDDAVAAYKAGEFQNLKKTYGLVIDKDTGEFVDFEFLFTTNPLLDLLKNKDGETMDKITKSRNGVATATTFIQGKPWAVIFQQEDLDDTISPAEKEQGIQLVAQGLLEHVVGGMAKGWYEHGLYERIVKWNHESNFEAIRDHFNGMVDAFWDKTGYSVDILVPDHSNPAELHVVKRNVSFNSIPQHQDPLNRNVDICQRYLDTGIISLIAFGYVDKGFTWKLN